MGKRCFKVKAHRRKNKFVDAHIRCVDKKGDKKPKPGETQSITPDDFKLAYAAALKRGDIPEGMTLEDVMRLSGYDISFGPIISQSYSNQNDGFNVTIETEDLFLRSIHTKDRIYIDLVKNKGNKTGFAKKMISNMVAEGERRGISKIELYGAATLNGERASGYYVWPRYGFETKNKVILKEYNSYDNNWKGTDSLIKLFSTQEGRDYYKKYGRYIPDPSFYEMFFLIKKGSPNRKAFESL